MKTMKFIIALLLLGSLGMSSAWADRGHVHFGVMIGPYWGGPWYYPPPYYYPPYYPPVVVASPAPQVYIEQQPASTDAPVSPAAPTATTQTNYWYYCAAKESYYPYVKDCPSGWQKVSPQPPDQP